MKHVSSSPPTGTTSPGALSPRPRLRGRERSVAHTFLFIVNILATITLLAALTLLYALPDQMSALQLTEQTTQMIILNLVSLLLLVAWLQRNLSGPWRAATLAAAFIVLAESWLVGLT